MSNHRVTNFAILSIEREFTETLDVKEIIKFEVRIKVSRLKTLLFRVCHISITFNFSPILRLGCLFFVVYWHISLRGLFNTKAIFVEQ